MAAQLAPMAVGARVVVGLAPAAGGGTGVRQAGGRRVAAQFTLVAAADGEQAGEWLRFELAARRRREGSGACRGGRRAAAQLLLVVGRGEKGSTTCRGRRAAVRLTSAGAGGGGRARERWHNL